MTVYKMIEIVGTSPTSIDEAINRAIERAGASVDGLRWFEVKEIRGRVQDTNAAEFQVKLDIGFEVHAPKRATKTARATATRATTKRSGRTPRRTSAVAAKRGARKPSRRMERE